MLPVAVDALTTFWRWWCCWWWCGGAIAVVVDDDVPVAVAVADLHFVSVAPVVAAFKVVVAPDAVAGVLLDVADDVAAVAVVVTDAAASVCRLLVAAFYFEHILFVLNALAVLAVDEMWMCCCWNAPVCWLSLLLLPALLFIFIAAASNQIWLLQ